LSESKGRARPNGDFQEAGDKSEATEAVETSLLDALEEVRARVVARVQDAALSSTEAKAEIATAAVEALPDDAAGVRMDIAKATLQDLPSDTRSAVVADSAGEAEESSSETATRRLNVVFSATAYDKVRQLANDSEKTVSEYVRDALALQKWFDETRANKWRILIEKPGRVREVLRVR
jgi:hypothetical protein